MSSKRSATPARSRPATGKKKASVSTKKRPLKSALKTRTTEANIPVDALRALPSFPHKKEHVHERKEHRRESAHRSTDHAQQADVVMAHAVYHGMSKPFVNIPPAYGTATGTTVFTNSTAGDYILTYGFGAAAVFPRAYNSFSWATPTNLTTVPSWYSTVGTADSQLPNFGQGRLLAMGIRWSVRYADNVVPGYVTAGLVPIITGTTDISNHTMQEMQHMSNMTTVDGRTAYDGSVTWRPLDTSESCFTTALVADSGIVSTNCPFVLFAGWPVNTTVRMEYIYHVEVELKSSVTLGFPASYNYGFHDWSVVMDHVRDFAGRAFNTVLDIGERVLARQIIAAAAGGSWYSSELRAAKPNVGLEPCPDGYTPAYLVSTIIPAQIRARESELSDALLAINTRLNAVQAGPVVPTPTEPGHGAPPPALDELSRDDLLAIARQAAASPTR